MFPGFTVKDNHLLEYIWIPVSHDFSGKLYIYLILQNASW